jgi:hypothetical protein
MLTKETFSPASNIPAMTGKTMMIRLAWHGTIPLSSHNLAAIKLSVAIAAGSIQMKRKSHNTALRSGLRVGSSPVVNIFGAARAFSPNAIIGCL